MARFELDIYILSILVCFVCLTFLDLRQSGRPCYTLGAIQMSTDVVRYSYPFIIMEATVDESLDKNSKGYLCWIT